MESKNIGRAKKLRSTMDPMHNCCQSVLIPFAEDLGKDIDTLYQATFNFSAGRKQGKNLAKITREKQIAPSLGKPIWINSVLQEIGAMR